MLDEELLAGYRRDIREGRLTPVAFRALLRRYATPGTEEVWSDPPPYDQLDTLIDGILQLETVPKPQRPPDSQMVAYQATPVRIVLEMVDRLGLTADDVFYDLGAGLGRVVFTVGLTSRARVKGVEIEPEYVDDALHRVRDLNLTRVSFINSDARSVDYSDGTIFFLYTPFKGKVLRGVLGLLRVQARTRQIRVCSYGPGTLEIQDQNWLTSDDDPKRDVHHVTVFESRDVGKRAQVLKRRRRV